MKQFTHWHWIKLLHDRRFYMTLLALVIDVGSTVFNWHMSATLLTLINGIIAVMVGGDTIVAAHHAKAAESAASSSKPTVVKDSTAMASSTDPTTTQS